MRQTLEDALRVVDALSVTTACIECEMHVNGYCEQWQADIPDDVQPKGCDHFEERIPF